MANEELMKKTATVGQVVNLAERTKATIEATKTELQNEINTKISSVYKPAGSSDFASLPAPAADVLGNVYNISDGFTTDDKFVDGAGKTYPAGTNVVVVQDGEAYKFDVLAGFVDLSGYVEKEDGKGLSANDFTNELKAKLDGVTEGATKVEASDIAGNIKINGAEVTVVKVASDSEVNALLDQYLPTV